MGSALISHNSRLTTHSRVKHQVCTLPVRHHNRCAIYRDIFRSSGSPGTWIINECSNANLSRHHRHTRHLLYCNAAHQRIIRSPAVAYVQNSAPGASSKTAVTPEVLKAYTKLQNGSDVRGVAIDCKLIFSILQRIRFFHHHQSLLSIFAPKITVPTFIAKTVAILCSKTLFDDNLIYFRNRSKPRGTRNTHSGHDVLYWQRLC